MVNDSIGTDSSVVSSVSPTALSGFLTSTPNRANSDKQVHSRFTLRDWEDLMSLDSDETVIYDLPAENRKHDIPTEVKV